MLRKASIPMRHTRWAAWSAGFIVAAIVLVALVAGLRSVWHTPWQDVTNTRYNGYAPKGIYRLQKPMQLAHFPAAIKLPTNYYIREPTAPGPSVDGELPVGTRIRFDKTLWAPSHEGSGAPVAYGTILDPPFESRFVNLNHVSDRVDLVGRAQPNSSFLAQDGQ